MLLAISAQTGEISEVHSFAVPARAAAWLPDGRGLLVTGVDPENGRGQIWFVSYPSGELSRFTNDLTDYNACCLEITRSGNSLVALQNTTLSDIWVAKADGSEAKQVTSGEPLGLGLDWVGNRITATNSRLQWVLMEPDGSKETPLTNDRSPHPQLSACRDGRHVIYSTFRDGTPELWRADGDGSNAVKYPLRSVLAGGGCMPDSKHTLYATTEGLWQIPIEGGTPEKVDLPLSLASLSRDGKLALYGSQKVEGGNMESKILVAPAAGGEPIHSFNAPYGSQGGQFTPDGKAFTYLLTRNRATNIWEQPLAGGSPVQLTKFTSGQMFAYAWSKDGKQLAFSRGQSKTDVVMISNFR